MASEVKTDKLSQRGSSGIVISDDIKLSSGKAITNASGADLLTEAGALGSSVGLKLSRNEGLVVKYFSATTVDIDADYLTLYDSSNFGYIASSVNLTAAITASGVNGLDTGAASEAASTWYHIWVIYNGTTVASLLSVSSAAPTLPSGYTYKKYVGAVYNDSSSNLSEFHQVGNYVSTPYLSAVASTYSTSYAELVLTNFVPTTALTVGGKLQGYTTTINGQNTMYFASNASGWGEVWSGTALPTGDRWQYGFWTGIIMIEPQTIYWKSTSTLNSHFIGVTHYDYGDIV